MTCGLIFFLIYAKKIATKDDFPCLSRANPSYKYLNSVQVVNTLSNSALPIKNEKR
jgi:hypothetical protein